MTNSECVAVVGLGYVGLPLVVEFGKTKKTIGFDLSAEKVRDCRAGHDPSREIPTASMLKAKMATFTTNPNTLAEADFILIAVPTPVDKAHRPDFSPLISASRTIAPYLKSGATVIYESTVYPGATEEICIPEIERVAKKTWKKDFFVGYSPERINPGDREHTLTKVIKVVSGDTPDTLEKIAKLYEEIVEPGVYRCSSIKAAEASKVIENTQRDLNIALMNELAIIFNKVGVDTSEVLRAAGTKWNFLNFTPGLVGGHCIGVDPYYLTHKAEMMGYHPQVILSGRRINDGMGKYIGEQTIKKMIDAGSSVKGAKVNVLGVTFKEDCGDIRNSKVIDVVRELELYGVEVNVSDPKANPEETMNEYGIVLMPYRELPIAEAVVIAVAHREFIDLGIEELCSKLDTSGVIIDVKGATCGIPLIESQSVWKL